MAAFENIKFFVIVIFYIFAYLFLALNNDQNNHDLQKTIYFSNKQTPMENYKNKNTHLPNNLSVF